MGQTGQQLGHYRLTRLIGSGSFADVYLAWDIYLFRSVAIKVLRQRLPLDHQQELLTEARVLARLEHPHIVRIIEFDIDDGIAYIVMKYMSGGSLRQRHPYGERLRLEVVIDYVWQIANALFYLHEQGVAHRDIKPENLLWGDDNQIYVVDFGIASVIRRTGQQKMRLIRGTVEYMAPERFAGHSEFASDQYAPAACTVM